MTEKLILICSDVSEGSTDVVCRWLNYYNKKFLRISSENIISISSIEINDSNVEISFTIDGTCYKLSDFKSYWYRRSYLSFEKFIPVQFSFEGVDLTAKMNRFLYEEYNKVIEFFKFKLNEIALLNRVEDNAINKLSVLALAAQLGINIPNTYILKDFSALNIRNSSYITKAISDFFILEDGKNYHSMTQRIAESDEDNLSHSLVQQEVNKRFEIRSFFFNRTFYSSAIFSQENAKTQLDFRNYDFDNPNNVVPYQLPKELQQKLLDLADQLNLKSGSFDIAYTVDDRYILFEVNPVGQFEQVSGPCNYNLHKLIAEHL